MSAAGAEYSDTGLGIFGAEATSVVLDNLVEGMIYRLRIRSIRGNLTSVWTESENFEILSPAPVSPVSPSLNIESVGVGSVSLSWACPDAVDGFELQVNAGGAGYVAYELNPLPETQNTLELTTLGQKASYSFRIRAIRDGLTSTWTESSTVTTMAPEPVAPPAPSLALQAIEVGSVTVSWTISEAVDSFELQTVPVSPADQPILSESLAATQTSLQVTNLVSGASYTFRIRAVRDGLASAWTASEVVVIPEPAPVPPVEPVLSIDAIGIGSVNLSWTIGEAVDSFELELNQANTGYTALASGLIAGTETAVQLSGLGEGIDYTFRIRAIREGLTSGWVESAVVTTLAPAPSPEPAPNADPVAPATPVLNVDSVGAGTATLSWVLDEEVESFEIEARQPGSNYAPIENGTVDGASRSFKVTGLDTGGRYSFQIRALRDGLYSDWGKTGNVKIEAGAASPTPPAAPVLNVDAVGIGSVALSWSVSETVDSFELELSEAGSAYTGLSTLAGTETSVLVDGLLQGVSYTFRIRALRSGVSSSWTESDPAVTLVEESSPGPVEPPVLEATHYWTFDALSANIAPDEGLNALDLDVSGASAIDGVGMSNSGLLLSGSHAGILIPDTATLNTGVQSQLTISIWVRPDAIMQQQTSVIYEQGSYWRGLNLILERGWLQASGWNRPQNESDWAGTTLDGGQLVVNEWNHIALVLSAGPTVELDGLKLYVNGQLIASGPASQLWKQNDDNGIGQVQQSTSYMDRQIRALDPFQGGIDDVSVWHAALSGQEIQDLILMSSN